MPGRRGEGLGVTLTTSGAVALLDEAELPGPAGPAPGATLGRGGAGRGGLLQRDRRSAPAVLVCWVIVTVLCRKDERETERDRETKRERECYCTACWRTYFLFR